MNLIQCVKAARAVGTPLLAITTSDQVAIITAIKDALSGHPALLWDRARGIIAINEEGGKALNGKDDLLAVTADPTSAMIFALSLPNGSVVYAMNMGTALRDEPSLPLIQAVSNLRDNFKASMRTLIMFDHQFNLPGVLRHDVTVFDDPLPSDEEYGIIVKKVNQLAKFPEANEKTVHDASVAVRGLSAFEAEQALSMAVALNPKKLDLRHVWDLKVAAINQVPGLTMTLDGPPLDSLRGMDALVKTMRRFAEGPLAPLVYVRVDEIEKAMAGLGTNGGPGDNTGITQDFLSQFLTQMEDNGWTGFIFAGIRGGGKTVLTKSVGAEYGVPTISMDIGSMKASHVGESLPGDAELYICDSKGGNVKRATMEQLYSEQPQNAYTYSYTDFGGFSVRKITGYIRHERKEAFVRVRTQHGNEVIVTEGHSLFARKKGSGGFGPGHRVHPSMEPIKAGDIAIGSRIATCAALGRPERPQSVVHAEFCSIPLTDRVGLLAGIWLGDGSVNQNLVRISSNAKDHETNAFIEGLSDRVVRYEKSGGEAHGVDYTIMDPSISAMLISLDVMHKHANARTKRIPAWVFGATDSVAAAVLRGYFSADGSFSGSNLEASSRSRQLAEDVSLLLRRFGIVPYLKVRWDHGDEMYRIIVSRSSDLRLFAAKIGFLQAYKNSALNAHLRSPAANLRHKWTTGRRSRRVLWDKVVSVEVLDRQDAYSYDISVESTERFVSGGIVVHNSEGRIRAAFKSISSVGRNRVCVLATSNDISVLPPEFLRRFKFGIYYFDLLSKDELRALWPIYMKEFNLSDQPTPNDEGWTGAEVRNCCEIAYGLGESLVEAAEKVVPVTKSDPASVNRLRHYANGNWLSAAKPGVYKFDGSPETLVATVIQIGGQRAEFNTNTTKES